MKTIFILVSVLFISFSGITQIKEDIDQISPFNEDLAAIQKGTTWAFIDTAGKISIDFREDLVTSTVGKQSYPVFKEGKCMIKQVIDGVYYYGYIDTKGQVVITPKYINATNFNHGHAIVLKLEKEKLGENKILGKNVVSYSYIEVVIDAQGNEKFFLTDPVHTTFKKTTIKTPPMIQSYLVSSNLAITKTKDKRLQLIKLKK